MYRTKDKENGQDKDRFETNRIESAVFSFYCNEFRLDEQKRGVGAACLDQQGSFGIGSGGENWFTEMSNEKMMIVLRLGVAA